MPRIQDRQRVVSIRLTRAEHAAAQAEAAACGAPIGAWLRLRMLDVQDDRARLAAIEARLAGLEGSATAQAEAVAVLSNACRQSFKSLAAMIRPSTPPPRS